MNDVSIIVPLYNVRVHLDQLTQNLMVYYHDGFELIFVEDGSADPVENEIKSRFPEATYIFQENKGAAEARNVGVALASRTYLQLMDADDTISSDKLDIQLQCATKTDADVVYSDWRNLYINKQKSENKPEPWNIEKQYDDIIEKSIRGWWTPTPCPIIRRQAYLEIGGMRSDLKVGEDTYFFNELALRGYKFVYCPGKFFTYHRYENRESLSQSVQSKTLYERAVFEIFKNNYRLIKEQNLQEKYHYLELVNDQRFHVARNLVKSDWEKAVELERQLRVIDPDFKPVTQTRLYRVFYRLFGFQITEKLSTNLYKYIKR